MNDRDIHAVTLTRIVNNEPEDRLIEIGRDFALDDLARPHRIHAIQADDRKMPTHIRVYYQDAGDEQASFYFTIQNLTAQLEEGFLSWTWADDFEKKRMLEMPGVRTLPSADSVADANPN